MKSELIGYHNQNFIFSANIQVNSPSGFYLHLSKTGDSVYDVVSFSGYSGYIFDQRGDFVGGYRKNQLVNISGNYFYGQSETSGNIVFDDSTDCRFSYFINNNLITNNISGQTGYFDTVRFEDYGENTMSFSFVKETGSPNLIVDSALYPIESADGYYLAGS